ncbi:MarR family transcriptional regulator [Bosea sp. ANAM02]|uniref:MarR family winged helix-turn-helix transcriptional regulator n=1 Tax=Bosea sp. ANAM02 TaxID=2020412 RepID=UPI00064894D1|nr:MULTISPECIES: MarR family transcriptional regulator [Hyphomicrobiales]BCB19055.1 MarR family transcriptional regulator [Bosea sp. ANAM02]
MSQERVGVQGGPMDSILAQWRRERPDLDTSVMAVCGDLWRAADRVRDGVAANLAGDDLDFAGFDVLLTLRRQGKGQALSPSGLAQDMMISTAAMTNRLDRLQKRGLIERQADPADRRALRIVLTEAGFALADRIVVGHVAAEERLMSALSGEERAELRRLLAKIG